VSHTSTIHLAVPLALLLSLFAQDTGWSAPVDFDRDIRPILADKCYACHGPDAKTREAELRLDTRQGALGVRDGKAAFRASKPDQSEALRRIFSKDADEQMPPADSKLTLTDSQKKLLRQWVTEGAAWNDHWAFALRTLPQRPDVGGSKWPRNDIDRFVLSRLVKSGLTPSLVASRETLIRRVTLDLTGLPPTPAEVDAFLADKSKQAYENVVDRLLKSPRYGERMAWEWLDASRYADTDGFQGDPTRTMWPWREWLIRSLNNNQPFDQFTIEMLAGDLLPSATQEQIVATGFNRNHMYNGEGGRIAEETRVENVFDRTETTSTVWLGLTMTCCRCHDHKFDPMTQQEYYQLYSFFNNTSESGTRGGGKAPPTLQYVPPEKRQQLAEMTRAIAALKKQMSAPLPTIDKAQAVWEAEANTRLAKVTGSGKVTLSNWSMLGPFPRAAGGAQLLKEDFGPEKGVDLKKTYADGKLVWRAEPKVVDGKVYPLSETVGATYFYRTLQSPGATSIKLSLGSDDGIKLWLNGKAVLSKDVNRAAKADQEKITLDLRTGQNELLIKIVNTGGIGGFYFKLVGESVGGFPPEIAKLLRVEAAKRNDTQRAAIRTYYRAGHSDQWKKWKGELTKLEASRSAIAKATVTVMVMDELPEAKRRKASVLLRGLYNKPLDAVNAGTPAFLPSLPKNAPRNRLALARWLVDPANPLTARVTVNRYWQTFFGTGLVKTSEDFGRQGSRPSHPLLLDWLASRFVASGWNVKAVQKLIVMSATYRQSSRVTPTLLQKDRENLLLSRGARHRMPSWMLRDQALAVSGLLTERIGGPSVKPYQPSGIWADATFGKIRYQSDKGESLYRRSLYIFWRRIVGPTMLFDSGKRQTCEVKPSRTNTPLHALTTLNETTFVEASRVMAQRAMQQGETPAERIQFAFRLAATRAPEPAELQLLTKRWKTLQAEFAAHPDEAAKLLAVGQSPRDTKLNAADHAAYTVVCSLLLNLDEVLTRE
jgi:hypothetical protein